MPPGDGATKILGTIIYGNYCGGFRYLGVSICLAKTKLKSTAFHICVAIDRCTQSSITARFCTRCGRRWQRHPSMVGPLSSGKSPGPTATGATASGLSRGQDELGPVLKHGLNRRLPKPTAPSGRNAFHSVLPAEDGTDENAPGGTVAASHDVFDEGLLEAVAVMPENK